MILQALISYGPRGKARLAGEMALAIFEGEAGTSSQRGKRRSSAQSGVRPADGPTQTLGRFDRAVRTVTFNRAAVIAEIA
ncbi:MAG TPA: hypothetical protein PKD24_11365 [Pyrinomonadaceae bacterium]|nr:hypothetical protein [Pyrinomonadaceae bacterium]HMP66114.1 hypothetical protein [Pyrinomonadaceae bacterium]